MRMNSTPLIRLTRYIGACSLMSLAMCSFAQSPGGNDQFPDKEIPGCKGLQWELLSKDCETFLPDIHYADQIQNRQMAELRLVSKDGKRYFQIDRLIYPTIGAPNLFFKGLTEGRGANINDELVVMLNLEDSELTPLLTDESKVISTKSPRRLQLVPESTEKGKETGLFIYLTQRNNGQRAKTAGANTLLQSSRVEDFNRISPVGIWRYGRPDDMPAALKKRAKLKLIFTQEQMADVNPGFYDIRMEIMNQGIVISHEFQYNAVRVFDRTFDQTNYEVLNITDSQASVGKVPILIGKSFRDQTLERLVESTHHIRDIYAKGTARNTAEDKILKAAFITFNGDLHNGGDPLILQPESVTNNYNDEAIAIIDALKELPLPIFLTIGNHDGYVSMGHVPSFIPGGKSKMDKVIKSLVTSGATDITTAEEFKRFLAETKRLPGGNPVDIFAGNYVRVPVAQSYGEGWIEPTGGTKRNLPLYDGFNQWKKTYGPLNQSWAFGNTTYINANSYDLRQHMRSGWGMYTVNYGGNVSSPQMVWIHREINRSFNGQKREAVLLAHHDPRGGHKNVGYPFYFRQIPFQGMDDSFKAYIKDEIVQPKICSTAPDWVKEKSTNLFLGCLQDGLQEWMRPDPMFDCGGIGQVKSGPDKGLCDVAKLKADPNLHPDYSGYKLIHEYAINRNLRTVVLGHTHYNSLEVLQPGDRIVPDEFILDPSSHQEYAVNRSFFDAVNPVRLFARWMGRGDTDKDAKKMEEMSMRGIVEETLKDMKVLKLVLEIAGHKFHRLVEDHELAILRFTSVAKLTEQELRDGLDSVNYGFQVLSVNDSFDYADKQKRSVINAVTFLRNTEDGDFVPVNNGQNVVIDRSKRIAPIGKENPFERIFDSTKSRPQIGPLEKLKVSK